jgi:hypothetical protein
MPLRRGLGGAIELEEVPPSSPCRPGSLGLNISNKTSCNYAYFIYFSMIFPLFLKKKLSNLNVK